MWEGVINYGPFEIAHQMMGMTIGGYMPDETDNHSSTIATDPIELWKRWNETTSKAWLNALQNSAEVTTSSYSQYRSWMQNVGESVNKAQEQTQGQTNVNPFQMMNPGDAWKTWFDATMETWKKAAEMGNDPLGLTRQWLNMMQDVHSKLIAGTPLQTDPFTLFKQWYDATSEQWSKAVEETISSKQFLEATRPLLESYASINIAFRRASEEYFKRLQLPTTTDIANVAQLVINLEEKVDTIEDALESFENAHANLATLESMTHLELRLEKFATTESIAALEHQVNHVATNETVAALEQRLNQLPTDETVSGLEQRLNQVESKLDKVLAALEKLEQHPTSTGGATARKTQKKSASKQDVQE